MRQIVFKFLIDRFVVTVVVGTIVTIVTVILLLLLHVTVIIIDIGGDTQNEHARHTDPNGTIKVGSLVVSGGVFRVIYR